MKVRLLTARATATGAQNRDDIIEASDAEAIRMIEAGQAVAVRSAPVERTTKARKKVEKAVK